MARYLKDDADLVIQSAQLYDVLTYVDHDDRDIQYTFILYLVSLSDDGSKVRVGQGYDQYLWKKLGDVNQEELTESAKLLLGISDQQVTTTEKNQLMPRIASHTPRYGCTRRA